ncbi:protein CDV3 homolog [Acanthaster planci]|uniref:Protein CDV3 homolog n=1 Tax=Acanthaster planci TaxID=133434 RepID=A0A8B7Y469_ACAPL|nr:protein CDV3 homolog [Acanthaster planci]
MSDKSLEDFFAKKDKSKKSKSKSKFAKSTTEEIAKRLTEADLKKERKEKEKEKPPPPKETEDKSKIKDIIGDEDDWRDNEEEKEKDYSGLKIQLQISANPDQDVEEEEEEELDENGEPVKSKGAVPSGPWNKLETAVDNEAEVAQKGAPPPTEPAVAPIVKSGKYIPPSLRGQPATKTSLAPSRLGGKSKAAPQISSEQEFPSLAASSDIAKHTDKNSDKNFEKVTRGGPSMPNPANQGPKLDLENRFAALGQN